MPDSTKRCFSLVRAHHHHIPDSGMQAQVPIFLLCLKRAAELLQGHDACCQMSWIGMVRRAAYGFSRRELLMSSRKDTV